MTGYFYRPKAGPGTPLTMPHHNPAIIADFSGFHGTLRAGEGL